MLEFGMGDNRVGFSDNWSLQARNEQRDSLILTGHWSLEKWPTIEEDIPSFILRSNPRRYGKPETARWPVANKIVATGLNAFLDCISGRILDSGWAPSGGVYFANWNGAIGAGDSSVAEAAGQTDLQAVTNKVRVNLNSGYPTVAASQVTQWQADFGPSVGNFSHAEVALFNKTSGGTMSSRKVVLAGTKSSGTWTWRLDLTATSGT